MSSREAVTSSYFCSTSSGPARDSTELHISHLEKAFFTARGSVVIARMLRVTTIIFVVICSSCLAWGAAPPTHDPSVHHHHHHETPLKDPASDRIVMDNPQNMHEHKEEDDHVGMDMNKTGHDMMMMYFHFGVSEYVLFKEWKITTVGGMVGSVIGVFLIGMLYEGLKYFREYLFKQYISSIQFSTVAITGEGGRVQQVHKVERHKMLSLAHAMQTALHVVQIIVSYFLMLIFMTYNVWLCIAVVLGAGVGYFIFGWKKASVVDVTEHCH